MQAELYLSGQGDQPKTLVVIFLRGAADGLSLVVGLRSAVLVRFTLTVSLFVHVLIQFLPTWGKRS